MYCNSSENWRGHRHGGNWWIAPVIFIGLIILTHGWIIILPLMLLAGVALVAFVLPKVVRYMHEGGWNNGEWQRNWRSEWRNRDWASEWHEKRKPHFEQWRNQWDDRRYEDKPKRSNPDHIDYV